MKKRILILFTLLSIAFLACDDSSAAGAADTTAMLIDSTDWKGNARQPDPPQQEIIGDMYIGEWDCNMSICRNDPWVILIQPGNGNYIVTADFKRENLNGPDVFPMKFQDGSLVPIGNEGRGPIFFEPGNIYIIHYGKWTFDRNPE